MQAVIMCGGKGTRISSITQDEIPKPMLKIGNKPILEHQIECLKASKIEKVTLVTGHLGEKIKTYFGDGEKFDIKIDYIEEDANNPLGTAGSLYFLKDKIKEDFILIFGDVFLSVDFNRMLEFHKKNKSDATLFTHPNSHPFDSDLIITDLNDEVITFDSKTNIRNYFYKNIVNAGIYTFSPNIFSFIDEPKKIGLEHDVIAKMIEENYRVYSYKSSEYVKDMGTPERYFQVEEDYKSKLPFNKNLANKQKCIFLDRDGTINKYVGFLRNIDDLELLPGVSDAIKKINLSEYLCIVITNQPVVARGEVTLSELENIHKKLETLLGNDGAYIDDLYYCPHHPDKGFLGEIPELKIQCQCRKPNIGLILKAAEEHNIDLNNSIIIGDTTLDIKLAENLKVEKNLQNLKSVLVRTGEAGNDNKYMVKPDYIYDDLNQAISNLID